jgi:hypothetical protein
MLGAIPITLLTLAGVASVRNLVNAIRAKWGLAHALEQDEAALTSLREALSRHDLPAAREALGRQVSALPGPVRAQAEAALAQSSPIGSARYMAALAGSEVQVRSRDTAEVGR